MGKFPCLVKARDRSVDLIILVLLIYHNWFPTDFPVQAVRQCLPAFLSIGPKTPNVSLNPEPVNIQKDVELYPWFTPW